MGQLQYPYSRANFAVDIVFAVLSTLAVSLRFYARKISQAAIKGDDYVILVVLVLALGLCIMSAWGSVHGGVGMPLNEQPPATAVTFLKITWAQEVISTPAIGLIKVSVLLFYRRIFTTRIFRYLSTAMILASIGWTIAFTCTLAFYLIPIDLQWSLSPQRTSYEDLNFAAMIVAMAVTDLFLDMVILSMPIPMIRRLHMPTRKKVVVGLILGLGAFCIVASAVRMSYIIRFINVYYTAEEFSQDESEIAIWSNIEPCASIICACLPTMAPLFRSVDFDGLLTKWRSYGSSRNYMLPYLFGSSRKNSSARGSDTYQQEYAYDLSIQGKKRSSEPLSSMPSADSVAKERHDVSLP